MLWEDDSVVIEVLLY